MLTTEIQQDTHSGPVTLNPRWLRIPAAVKYSGLSRSRLYELLSERKIRSICVKSHKGAERGVRLLDRESIDTFMLALQTEAGVSLGLASQPQANPSADAHDGAGSHLSEAAPELQTAAHTCVFPIC